MAMSYPFQGKIWYDVESTYNGGFPDATPKRISDAVTDVRIETGDINQSLRTISEVSLADFSATMVDPMLHIEWVYQPNASGSLVSECYNRVLGELNSLAFEIGINTSRTSDAWYRCTGCKCKTFTVSASTGENYIVTADFSVASLGTYSSASCTEPSAIGTDYAAFNIAGGVTWSGVTGAYVTKGFSFTVENNLTDYWDVGSTAKKAAIPGGIDLTGSCDISLDDGGKVHFDEVIAGTDITSLVFNTGRTTGNHGKFTLNSGRFDNTSIDENTDNEGAISSVPFTFKTLTLSTGT